MKNIAFTMLLITLATLIGRAQITGTVYSLENGKTQPLPGANLLWEGTDKGTVTDASGIFSIEKPSGATTLIASFIGLKSESKIVISRKGVINFTLSTGAVGLEEATVTGKVDATSIDVSKPELTYKIDDKELRKAACCNLSESFETNASVDASFTDAVTGTKQIEMLGLAGKYALIQRENIPFARGLNATTGLSYIPGPFIESIQLTKGLSSVLNGYESITGQINTEFYKPETSPRLLINAYMNQGGRSELNVISGFDLPNHTHFGILAHASTTPFAQDMNSDGFADIPTGRQYNIMPRWHWHTDNGWEGQLGVHLVNERKKGGQIDFINEDTQNQQNAWGYTSNGSRYEFFGKSGYIFKGAPNRSLGLIYNTSYQDRSATFNDRSYNGSQTSVYFNSIYQDIIGDTRHKFRTGLSFQGDIVEERLKNNPANISLYQMERNEWVPGAYFEYTFEPNPQFTMVGGVRGDYNSYFNAAYITPRLNARYAISENTTIRLGGGRGQRTPNVMAENLNVLASNRALNFANAATLLQEIAWNTGASITQNFKIGDRKLVFNADGFYTWFDTKLVADLDANPQMATFLLNQGSRSFSFISQLDIELLKFLDWRLAYKYLDAQEQFIHGLNQSLQVPKNRAFTNLAFATESQWKFDATLNWFGSMRLPNTELNPTDYQKSGRSNDYFTLNIQVNKNWENGIEAFVGVENLLNFQQENPINSANDPSSPYFDTNFIYGPVFGRMVYAGLYYRLKRKD